jgi:hypothetical protein
VNFWEIALALFVAFLLGVRFGLWVAEAPIVEDK